MLHHHVTAQTLARPPSDEDWASDACVRDAKAWLDELADHLCSGRNRRRERSRYSAHAVAKPAATGVMLYTADFRPGFLAAAVHAGFFCFGSEIQCPGQPLEDRCLLNLEICARHREPRGEDTGGRIVLDLSSGARMHVGAKSFKTVRACTTGTGTATAAATAAGAGAGASAGHRYRLTANSELHGVWDRIVKTHGTDWLGFTAVRRAYAALRAGSPAAGPTHPRPQLVSIELWDADTGTMASAEVGMLVGSCYSCLSVFADTDAYPRCDRVRTEAAVVWLSRAGVRLFDAGTTAGYYCQMFGYARATRTEFIRAWRQHRGTPLHSPSLLATPCDAVRELLAGARNSDGASPGPSSSAASAAAAARCAGGEALAGAGATSHRRHSSAAGRCTAAAPPPAAKAFQARGAGGAALQGKGKKPKHAAKVTGLPPAATHEDVMTAFGKCGAVRHIKNIAPPNAPGFWLVVFEEEAALEAAHRLDGATVTFGSGAAARVGVEQPAAKAKDQRRKRKQQGQGAPPQPQPQQQQQQQQQQHGRQAPHPPAKRSRAPQTDTA